jgi:hypothetical protein
MKNQIQQALNVLSLEMQELGACADSTLIWAKSAIQYHDKCLVTLRSIVSNSKFKSISDEVEFFKCTKPTVFGAKLFYHKLISFESRKPLGTNKIMKSYLADEINKAQDLQKNDNDFYAYIRGNKTHLDELYFLREPRAMEWDFELTLLCCDSQFSTGYDLKVALFIAHKCFIDHISNELMTIKRKCNDDRQEFCIPKWRWSDTKIALVELIYALHTSRSINNGNADLKEIASFFESVFKTNLGDIYHNYLQVKGRQNPTKFMDTLKNGLLQRMEEQNN